MNVLSQVSCLVFGDFGSLGVGPVTEFLSELEGAPAAALCRLPLGSVGVIIIMWAGMLEVKVSPLKLRPPPPPPSLVGKSEATHI